MATKVNVNVNTTTLLIIGGAAALYYIYSKAKNIDVYNEPVVINTADYFFGAIDLINPFAPEERRNYAKRVYGFGD